MPQLFASAFDLINELGGATGGDTGYYITDVTQAGTQAAGRAGRAGRGRQGRLAIKIAII